MTKLVFAPALIILFPLIVFSQSETTELIVKGRVLDYVGSPVAGASVTAGPIGPLKRGVVPTAKSGPQGEFSVVVHQTGEFLISAAKPSERYPSTANTFYYPFPATAALVTVIADQPPPFATVQFGPKAGELWMRVLDAQTKAPVRGVMISLCRVEAPRYCHRFQGNNNEGAFSTMVPSTPFTLQISAGGYDDAYGDIAGQSGLQVMQLASETTRQITILMRKSGGGNEDLLPAPKIVSPPDNAEFYDTPHPRTLTLEWSPVPGAKSYTVEVEVCEWEKPDGGKCTKGTTPLTRWKQEPPPSGVEGTKYELVFPGTQPGRWRVWAVDAKERPGAKTLWSLFFYKSEIFPVPR